MKIDKNLLHVKTILNLAIAIAFVIPFGNLYSQTTVNINSLKDNTLYEDVSGNTSNGAGKFFFSGKTAGGSIRRGLIAFDIASNIPPCATVTSVTLTLHMSKTSALAKTISLRKVSQNWGEGLSAAHGEEGGGATAQTGDATWLYTFYNTASWSSVGGTFSTASSDSLSVDAVGFYTWPSTIKMINDVQGWVNNPSANYGWLLLGDESSFETAKRFDTKENDSLNFRPKLTVTYTLNSLALNLTALIEGLWNGTAMVSDTSKVYLRNSVSPYAKVDSAVSVLNSSGNGVFCFSHAGTGSYYIVVSHRNSIDTWSKFPQSFITGVLKNYDFTTAASQAFGNNMVLKSGKYAIYSGDANKDGFVDLTDLLRIFNDSKNFVSGYVVTDINGDNFVDLSDLIIASNNASNFVSVITP